MMLIIFQTEWMGELRYGFAWPSPSDICSILGACVAWAVEKVRCDHAVRLVVRRVAVSIEPIRARFIIYTNQGFIDGPSTHFYSSKIKVELTSLSTFARG